MRQPSHPRPGQGYHLGVDLGSTCTAAAVCRAAEPGRPEPVQLGESAAAIATTAFLTDGGELLVGEPARRRSATDPQRVARGFTRRIGDDTPLVLGDATMTAAEIAARFVRCVVDLVTVREGGAPDGVALTHPAGWGAHRRDTLTRALAAQGVDDVLLVTEPAAAALGHTGPDGLAPGSVLAVYDLGGDSFDTAVLGGGEDGTPELLGRPVGRADLGGVDFDEHVLDHVRDALGDTWDALDPTDPDVLAAVAVLRRECTAAKEVLSADVDAAVPVMLPGAHTRVRIARADFEDRIRRDVEASVEALLRALDDAGTDPSGPETVLLVGGSSRIPLVPQTVSAALGRPVTVDTDPRTTVARGAALAAHRQATPPDERTEIDTEIDPVIDPAPAAAPVRPAVPHLATATPEWPAPAGRRRVLRLRGALVAALASTGIALAAAATVYTLDPTLLSGLSGEAPAALIEPATPDAAVNAGAATTVAEPPAPAPAPAAAAPVQAAVVPARHSAPAPRKAVRPTAVVPPATPVIATSAPTTQPAGAAPTTASTAPGTGTTGTPPATTGTGGSTTGGSSSAPAPANPAPVVPAPANPAPTNPAAGPGSITTQN